MKTFSVEENRILNLFKVGEKFILDDKEYTITLSGKPTCDKGEPKTDIYVSCDANGQTKEIKISFKKDNADFLENKISAERAEQIFGPEWKDVIIKSTLSIEDKFKDKYLIYKEKFGRTQRGSITLGWKFELTNKLSGELSDKLILTPQQVLDIYAGTNISDEKKNSKVNDIVIKNSGIANYILIEKEKLNDLQSVIKNITPIEEYAKNNSDIYFACKALNYRSFADKYDGDRPLAVFIKWTATDGKLSYDYNFDAPLVTKGTEVCNKLKSALSDLNKKTTNDIKDDDVKNSKIIFK